MFVVWSTVGFTRYWDCNSTVICISVITWLMWIKQNSGESLCAIFIYFVYMFISLPCQQRIFILFHCKHLKCDRVCSLSQYIDVRSLLYPLLFSKMMAETNAICVDNGLCWVFWGHAKVVLWQCTTCFGCVELTHGRFGLCWVGFISNKCLFTDNVQICRNLNAMSIVLLVFIFYIH